MEALGIIAIFWFTGYLFYRSFKKRKLDDDYKKSIIETEKHLRKMAENSERNSKQ